MAKRYILAAVASAIGLWLVAFPGVAQEKADAKIADDPDAKSSSAGSASRVVVDLNDAEAKATARIADSIPINDDYKGRYALTVTAPFNSKKDESVDVGTLSGLNAGTSATLELGGLRWTHANENEAAEVEKVCEQYVPKFLPGYSWHTVKGTGVLCHADFFAPAALAELIKKLNAQRAVCGACQNFPAEQPPLCEVLRSGHQRSCSKTDDSNAATCALLEKGVREECAQCAKPLESAQAEICNTLARVGHRAKLADISEGEMTALLKEANDAMRPRAAHLFRPLSILTMSVKINKQHFDYVLADDLATARKTDEKGLAFALAYTHVLRKTAWSFGYSHEESFKGADKVQVCTPIGTTGASSCKEGVIGAPQKTKAELAFVESRSAFSKGRFGFAPRVEHDFKQSKWAARLPIYFLANDDKQLTAGLSIGYSEAKDEKWGAAVFISKAFKFYE